MSRLDADLDPVPKSVTLDRESSDIVWTEARESYDGNFSLALRKIVKQWRMLLGPREIEKK